MQVFYTQLAQSAC